MKKILLFILIIQTNLIFAQKLPDAAQKTINNALNKIETLDKVADKEEIATHYTLIAATYNSNKNNSEAIEYYLKAVNSTANNSRKKIIQETIGAIYLKNYNYDKAIEYYNQALTTSKKIGNTTFIYECQVIIANIYEKTKEYQKAALMYEKALKTSIALNQKAKTKKVLKNIKKNYSKLGNSKKVSQIEAIFATNNFSEENINKLYFKKTHNKTEPVNNNLINQLLYAKHNSDEIEKILTEENQNLLNKVDSVQAILQYKSDSLNALAFEILKKQQKFEEKQKAYNLLKIKFDNTIKTLIGFAILGLIILLLAFFMFRAYSIKKKQYKLLKEQKEEIQSQATKLDEQNVNILASINYAKRIQKALLTPIQILNKLIPNNFILYLPKDIVSGDFYWLTERENKTIVAVADCTGHGVPGAFMSMLGTSLLNEISKKTIIANEILNQLRKQVINTLHQTQHDTKTSDGMDISLSVIDNKNNKLQFAGAYNSLIIVRNNEIIETKADRMPIGIHRKYKISFTNKNIALNKNDIVYMYTDGYIDQFGGKDNKKFLIKRFRKLLLEISANTLPIQKQILLETINKWRKQIEQLDDITILGFKIK